ncbi:hypothetical protein HDF24_14600 [Mucilaginibacter sp. X4EP1]|uniref:hypothetical protein n=1 Tax=Mucilaginibacter sp. X4EP1 TaxID=2723092 RepID=UPI00216A6B1F|nr:hypothetical protein [Mucilaginibacter sp. X4EP1]MCS3815478.1 hypothetical protein [Mucilaginibacter sp. X4EP1]
MKKLVVSITAIAGILVACHSINSNKDFIPGTYTNHAESPYSQADDTLTIAQAGSDNIYTVTRKTGYHRMVNGKADSLRHQLNRWTATWDEQKEQLVILQTGGILTFPQSGNSLLYGSSEYRRR